MSTGLREGSVRANVLEFGRPGRQGRFGAPDMPDMPDTSGMSGMSGMSGKPARGAPPAARDPLAHDRAPGAAALDLFESGLPEHLFDPRVSPPRRPPPSAARSRPRTHGACAGCRSRRSTRPSRRPPVRARAIARSSGLLPRRDRHPADRRSVAIGEQPRPFAGDHDPSHRAPVRLVRVLLPLLRRQPPPLAPAAGDATRPEQRDEVAPPLRGDRTDLELHDSEV